MKKVLLAIIQVNLCYLLQASQEISTKLTQIAFIEIFAINLQLQLFLGCHLNFKY